MQVAEQLLGEVGADRHVVEAGVRGDADERAFELTDVGGDA